MTAPTPNAAMTPGERRELRTVVRQRLKVLRADVAQRRMELLADAEARLVERYRAQDKQIEDLNFRIAEIAEQASRDITDLIIGARGETEGVSIRRPVRLQTPRLSSYTEDRSQLHRAMVAGVEAQVKTALLGLDRQEADLLQQLALQTIETDAARQFLATIPSVGELVPAARLAEIEATFDERRDGVA
jgi:hypothetical protein